MTSTRKFYSHNFAWKLGLNMHKHVKSRPEILKLDSLNISLSSWFWIFLKWSYMWMNNWFRILAFFWNTMYVMVWFGLVWFCSVFYLVLFCLVWFGLVWYGLVWFETTSIRSYCENFIQIRLVLTDLEKI